MFMPVKMQFSILWLWSPWVEVRQKFVSFFLISWKSQNFQDFCRFGNKTQLTFRFKDESFYPLRRSRQFAITDFFCNVGGVSGLFAGISVLSFIEIFYFFTFRIISNIFISKKVPKLPIIIVTPAEWLPRHVVKTFQNSKDLYHNPFLVFQGGCKGSTSREKYKALL